MKTVQQDREQTTHTSNPMKDSLMFCQQRLHNENHGYNYLNQAIQNSMTGNKTWRPQLPPTDDAMAGAKFCLCVISLPGYIMRLPETPYKPKGRALPSTISSSCHTVSQGVKGEAISRGPHT